MIAHLEACESCGMKPAANGRIAHRATVKISEEDASAMIWGSMDALATDGCPVEPDGTCEHGHESVLIVWGYI